MSVPETPTTSPNLYPQELELKLYQAFFFSIPILFSIILFLLFYLFYLKRRASLSSPPHFLPTSAPSTTSHSTPCRLDLTLQFLDTLPKVLFGEELKARDSQCCICLGEFEIKDEVLQIPECKHVFHRECIYHWLHSHTTCPLCRCCIIPPTKFLNPPPLLPPPPPLADEASS